jgi:hypothetical protein
MPIPKPKGTESESEFVSRCMADSNMQEYEKEQRSAICYNTYKNNKSKKEIKKTFNIILNNLKNYVEKLSLLEVYKDEIEEVKKSKTIEGYESPEPGELSEAGADLLARIYSKCRSDGGDKEKCSKIAWSAVHQAGYKSFTMKSILEKYNNIIHKLLIKKKEQINKGKESNKKNNFSILNENKDE